MGEPTAEDVTGAEPATPEPVEAQRIAADLEYEQAVAPLLQLIGASDDRLVAQVHLPAKEDLAVELVPLAALQRLDEAQSDTTLMQTLSTLFLGAVLGFLTNVLTTDDFRWTPIAVAFVVLLAVIASCFGGLWARAGYRHQRIRRRILESRTKSTDLAAPPNDR